MRQVKLIILHCSATPADMDIGAARIREWHTAPPPKGRGWQDIAYHYVIQRNGFVDPGRDTDGDGDIFEEVGAHTVGYNKESIGICLVGGINGATGKAENNFTHAQCLSLVKLLKALKKAFPVATIHGHNEFAAKDCPSFDVQKWLKGVVI